jgi:predicted AAA+ superfamily ATPase
MIKRTLQDIIENKLFRGKAIIIIGARQVGKSTLMRQIVSAIDQTNLYLDCDDPEIRRSLTDVNIQDLHTIIGPNKIVVIDEAQLVMHIGTTLKLIIDNMPEVQLIVSGSSAFELLNRLNEPLTGRKFEYHIYPISTEELFHSKGLIYTRQTLESRLIYGSYPDIINHTEDAKDLLMNIAESYLYKDLLMVESIRKPVIIEKLLIALSLQVCSEVSYNELAQTVGTDSKTVEKYIDLLEKCFVVFRLNAFSRNLRTELKKSKKIYFYDNGIRNALIKNFAPLQLRQDVGALWENFFISERIKYNHYHRNFANYYFWRTTQQQEIDFIEESDGLFTAFEMKWNPKKMNLTLPKPFTETYQIKDAVIITPDNYLDWVKE